MFDSLKGCQVKAAWEGTKPYHTLFLFNLELKVFLLVEDIVLNRESGPCGNLRHAVVGHEDTKLPLRSRKKK